MSDIVIASPPVRTIPADQSGYVSLPWVKWFQSLWQRLNSVPYMRSQAVATGAIVAGGNAQIVLTWANPFADANYSVTADVLDNTIGTSALRVHHVESLTSTIVKFRVVNDDGVNPHIGTLMVLGIHQ